jgi:hypothetical protein
MGQVGEIRNAQRILVGKILEDHDTSVQKEWMTLFQEVNHRNRLLPFHRKCVLLNMHLLAFNLNLHNVPFD